MNRPSSTDQPLDPRELARMELATQNHLPAGASLDAETARLREGYLALAQLLEASDISAAVLLETDGLPAEQPAIAPASRTAPAAGGHWTRSLGWIAAAAAVVLLAIFVSRRTGEKKSLPQPDVVKTGQTAPQATAAQTAESNTESPSPALAASAAQPGWEDSLDEAIAQTGERLSAIRTQSALIDGGLEAVDGRLRQFGSELQSGSL